MDESSFEIDAVTLAEAARRFPARRLAGPNAPTARDLNYLAQANGVEFARHAWDEGGHF